MSNFIQLISGTSYDKNDVQTNGLRVLRGGNIQNFNLIIKNDDVFLPLNYKNNNSLILQNDILIVASTGSKEVIGKPAFVECNYENTTIGAFLRIIRPLFEKSFNYLKIFYMSEYYRNIIRESVRGTNINNLKADTILNMFFPLPPFEEQQRIVDKINSFEPLLQEYEGYEKKLTELESTFADKLKKSILQYAIEGKLVKQDPNDEPASVLLERIKSEKEKLIKEGKIKRDKNESYIYQGDDKNYYENLPNGWSISNLKSITSKIVDGNHNPPCGLTEKTKYLMLSSQNIGDNQIINLHKVRYLSEEQFKLENRCCGKHYSRKTTPYKHVWLCRTNNEKGIKACNSKQVPEEILFEVTNNILDTTSFDEKLFKKKIEKIIVKNDNFLTYVFNDGTLKDIKWENKSRSLSWTPEKKALARQKTLEQHKLRRANNGKGNSN